MVANIEKRGANMIRKRRGLNWSSTLPVYLQVKRLLPLILLLVRKKLRVEMMTVLGIMKQWRILIRVLLLEAEVRPRK